jgi:Na+-transporting NADH:ubiquinone oxidoreductase subunit C
MSNDSTSKTIIVTLGVCLVCSILVSTAAVTLKNIQDENKKIDRLENILKAGDLFSDPSRIEEIFNNNIQVDIVDLSKGSVLDEAEYNDDLNPEDFDIKSIAKHPDYSIPIPSKEDIARIKRKPRFMPVYKVRDGDRFVKLIFPVFGQGLWSRMYGLIALDKDLQTIHGFTFYEHGETPGLGGEVDNPGWKKQWIGKHAFDRDGQVKITVLKGKVDPLDPSAKYQIDGLSGSTLTTRGIDNTIKYWLGNQGYGPFIQSLRTQG